MQNSSPPGVPFGEDKALLPHMHETGVRKGTWGSPEDPPQPQVTPTLFSDADKLLTRTQLSSGWR